LELHKKCSDILGAAQMAQQNGFTILPAPTLNADAGKCDVDVYGGDTAFVIPPAESVWVTKYPCEVGHEKANYLLDGTAHEMTCYNFVNLTVSCDDARQEAVCNQDAVSNPYLASFQNCVADECDDPAQILACNKKVCPSHVVDANGVPSCQTACWGS
jgi:hypothetical protein